MVDELQDVYHGDLVQDTNDYFVINDVTRVITVGRNGNITLGQFDHNSQRFTFKISRYVDGHDMSECNKVEIHYINIGVGSTDRYKGLYEVTDLHVDPDDSEYVLCSWLVSQNATRLAGTLNFIVHYACLTDGVIEYSWHSGVYKGLKVGDGISNTAEVIEQYVDVLEEWKLDLVNAGLLTVKDIDAKRTSALTDISNAHSTAKSDIDTKRTQALSAIDLAKSESVSDVNDARSEALSDIDKASKQFSSSAENTLEVMNNAQDAYDTKHEESMGAIEAKQTSVLADINSAHSAAKTDIEAKRTQSVSDVNNAKSEALSDIDKASKQFSNTADNAMNAYNAKHEESMGDLEAAKTQAVDTVLGSSTYISEHGTWVVGGKDTGVKATPSSTVHMHGAKGDGVTDDTAAFKAALAAERVVVVPGGTYKLSSGIQIGANCMLELSQDTVLNFTNTSGDCITLLRLANIKGNHATINVPYGFRGNVINCDTGADDTALDPGDMAGSNAVAVPPFKKWSPQWKMSRYVTDINICKPKADGEHNSVDGTSSGTAVYVHCDKEDFVSFMWGVTMSGIRIAGAFDYGIRAYNLGEHVESWNHDMRIEAVVDSCKVGVSLENCYYARLEVSVQARSAANGAVYATHGIELRNSRGVDLSGSRVWDWNETNSLWASGNEYQHLALYGECRGLILDDFMYYEVSTDIRELIYTDRTSNLEQMTLLQEPFTRWFKPKKGEPIFYDGFTEKKLITQDHLDAHFDTGVIKNFTDVLATATDESGAVLDGKGYTGGFLTANGGLSTTGDSGSYYRTTGFIPCAKGQTMYVEGMSYVSYDGSCTLCMYDADKKFISTVSAANLVKGTYWYAAYEATANGFKVTPQSVVGNENVAYIRFTVLKSRLGDYPMVSVDEEIKYTVEGFLADGIKVKGENVVGLVDLVNARLKELGLTE